MSKNAETSSLRICAPLVRGQPCGNADINVWKGFDFAASSERAASSSILMIPDRWTPASTAKREFGAHPLAQERTR